MNGRPLNLALLGATGSIGTSTLRVLRAMPGLYRLRLISAGGNHIEKLAAIAAEFHVPQVVTSDPGKLDQLRSMLPSGSTAYAGESALCELLGDVSNPIDTVLAAIIGNAALMPVVRSIEAGRTLALASKEVLVTAGTQIMRMVKDKKIRLLPVDSEHSAIFQCLERSGEGQAERIILTASGGPFRGKTTDDLMKVTREEALHHPVWSMGPKVTLDSATLMNKALEMIEAHHLFAMPPEKIGVLVHPQSVIHSMVEWRDGAVQALLSVPDMCFPIQYALTWPERVPTGLPRLDLAKYGALTFEDPDESVFPSLAFARRAMTEDGTMPTVMNAANEAACIRFCAGEIPLPGIWRVIEKTMDAHRLVKEPVWADIPEADAWARSYAAGVKI